MTISTFSNREFNKETIVELLAMPDASEIEFEVPKLTGKIYRVEEFDY